MHFIHVPVTSAFNPQTDADCVSPTSICLTSFKWCDNDGTGCFYPPGADPLMPGSNAAPYAVLYHHRQYEITWKQAVPGVPVLIEWLFETTLKSNLPYSQKRLQVQWNTNTTKSSYTFYPQEILQTFPTAAAPNISSAEAITSTEGPINVIRVSQPETGGPSMMSDQFLVQSAWTAEVVRNLREHDASIYAQQQKNWQLGVGVGVGFGLPLLVTLAWFGGHRVGAQAGYQLANKLARPRTAV